MPRKSAKPYEIRIPFHLASFLPWARNASPGRIYLIWADAFYTDTEHTTQSSSIKLTSWPNN